MKPVVRIIITLVLIVVGVFLILFAASRLAGFGTIPNMLSYMGDQVNEMWRRITS